MGSNNGSISEDKATSTEITVDADEDSDLESELVTLSPSRGDRSGKARSAHTGSSSSANRCGEEKATSD